MDFASLRVFKTVVEEGGITPAAKRLNRVQSNVTTRIQQLEASLGTQLFVRERGRLHLSPAGETFLDYATRILELAAQARAALDDDVPRGVLRIGTLESTAASRLPPLLAHYHEAYPDVRLELTTGTSDALIDAVSRREVEATFAAGNVANAELRSQPAFREELVLIAPRSHPKIGAARDVRADSVIAFPSGCFYRRELLDWLARGQVYPERTLELGSYHAIVACVASGSGIAAVPRSVLATIKGADGVATYPLGPNRHEVVTSLIWRQGEVSAAFKALLAEVTKQRKTA